MVKWDFAKETQQMRKALRTPCQPQILPRKMQPPLPYHLPQTEAGSPQVRLPVVGQGGEGRHVLLWQQNWNILESRKAFHFPKVFRVRPLVRAPVKNAFPSFRRAKEGRGHFLSLHSYLKSLKSSETSQWKPLPYC